MKENFRISGHNFPVERCDSGPTILCVEDDDISRELLCKIVTFRFPDAKIHAAQNGRKGLDVFRKCPADIVLTDINMPVMDGYHMASQIRTVKPDVCIIAVSTHSDLFGSDKKDGIFDYCMGKPVNSNELKEKLESCIARIPGRANR